MKKEYKTPTCDIITLLTERFLTDSITESTGNAQTKNDVEFCSRGANSDFGDD